MKKLIIIAVVAIIIFAGCLTYYIYSIRRAKNDSATLSVKRLGNNLNAVVACKKPFDCILTILVSDSGRSINQETHVINCPAVLIDNEMKCRLVITFNNGNVIVHHEDEKIHEESSFYATSRLRSQLFVEDNVLPDKISMSDEPKSVRIAQYTIGYDGNIPNEIIALNYNVSLRLERRELSEKVKE